jgi:uncharacterized membrane protein YdjX (TVP38/TMEM64 family)
MQLIKGLVSDHPKIFNRDNYLKFLGLIIILAIAIWGSMKFDFEEIKPIIRQNQGQAIIISLVIYVVFGFTFLPSVPLTLFIAVLIGPFQAAVVAALGNTLAAVFEYQIGKTVGDVVAFEEVKKKLPFGLNKLPVDSPLFLLGARSIPAGSRTFSVVCGAYQVPMPTYLWTTSLMYFVTSSFLAYGGSKLFELL